MVISYDLETTGFGTNNDGTHPNNIVEVGYVKIIPHRDPDKDWIVGAGLFHFWRKGWNILPDVTETTGLDNDLMLQLTNNASMENYFNSMSKLYSLTRGNILLGKNNHNFDDKLVTQLVRNMLPRDLSWQPEDSIDYGEVGKDLFNLKMKEKLKPGEKHKRRQGKLIEHCELFGITPEQINALIDEHSDLSDELKKMRSSYHSALFDAMATYLCWKEVRKDAC